MTLDTPVTELPTVRGRVAEGFQRLGIRTVRHLLFHFPTRHEDRRTVTPVARVAAGAPVVVRGVVKGIRSEQGFRRHGGRARRLLLTHAVVADETGELPVAWFHQRFLVGQYPAGTPVLLSGTAALRGDVLTLVAPEIERATPGKVPIHAARLVPIYPETAGVTSRLLRFLVHRALPLADDLAEYLPEAIRVTSGLLGIASAVRGIHFPKNPEELAAALRRLSFDELFLLQLSALQRKRARFAETAVVLPLPEDVVADAVRGLPFILTPSQEAAVREILADLRQPVPMNRLLAGDVGSGKTVVAGLAALAVARASGQTALVAPTEILALQHADTLKQCFASRGLRVELLTGSRSPADKAAVRAAVARGDCDCLVGTHALFHAELSFWNLVLVVVDEQHRFGVEQRAELTARGPAGVTPHFLSLTATPIPRTLQLTAYGDVDVTLLAPRPGQQRIRTEVVPPGKRNTVYASLQNCMRGGEQVFVICPRVEDVEDADTEMRSVVREFERLRTEIFSSFRVGMLHGGLPTEEKQRVLAAFRARELDVLVSSSVVEVGVDIPGATALLIEGAERFGLAQLHQFRGRVGRQGQAAVCYLASTEGAPEALNRLRVLEQSADGLTIAEEDLRQRGAGEIYGTRQSGGVRLRVANIADLPFLETVRQAAETFLRDDAELASAPLLRKRVSQLNVTTHFE